MTDSCPTPFGTYAKVYRERGFWPRPVVPGKKAAFGKDWQKPDPEQSVEKFTQWDSKPQFGIGLLMGSPFPDGTYLGALDIDHDLYVELGKALLGNPPCGRVGKKGVVFFVRYPAGLKSTVFKVKGEENKRFGHVAETLLGPKFCVLPPTIHPDTGRPYTWIGTPLHDIEFTQLPLIGD